MNQEQKIIIIMISCALFIIMYSKYRCNHPEYKDPLTKGNKLCTVCDGWSISHLLFFMFLGYNFPKKFQFIMIIGIIWELLEYLVSNTNIKIFDFLRGVSTCKISTDTLDDHWFYSKWSDLVMNLIGFIAGRYISSQRLIS